jgi:predicted membrane protein
MPIQMINPWRLFGPALIIWIGITILLKASRGPNSSQRPRRRERHVEMNFERSTNQPGRSSTVDSRDTVSATAILGGFDRKATSQEFRGGDLTTILGGGKVDLRDCNLHPDGAFLDVFTLMGGIEIFVPPDWVVESRVTPVLGSFEDTTHPPKESTKRITLDGTAIMGGVSIKN